MSNEPDLPDEIIFDPANPPDPEDLPVLPEGYRWEIQIRAEADVLHADGSVN